MSKNKRMVYIYDENVEVYNNLENKSDWLNQRLEEEKKKENNTPTAPAVEEDTPYDPDWHPDPRIRETRKALREMEERDRGQKKVVDAPAGWNPGAGEHGRTE